MGNTLVLQAAAAKIASLIILTLLPVVVFGSKQQAVLAWFLMGNLDASAGEGLGASASSLGLLNAVKGIVIPLLLTWRLKEIKGNVLNSGAGKLWITLTLYSTIAAFWSPFPLAAAKLVVNLIGILLTFIVFERAGKLGLLGTRFLATAISLSLALGVVQSYFLGGPLGLEVGGYSGHGDDNVRFTSFIAPNLYGALLVAFLVALLSARLIQGVYRLMMVLIVLLAILLSGSRVWLTGALILFSANFLLYMRKRSTLIFSHFLGAISILTTAIWGEFFYNYISLKFPRLGELLDSVFGGSGVDSVGTYSLREGIYDAVWQDMRSSNALQIIFGHGTSSGGYVFSKDLANIGVDVNRIFHNEWLRVLYEWGILGLLIFLGVFVCLFVWLTTAYIRSRKPIYIGVFFYLITLCIYIRIENILAGAGNAVTMGFPMLLGLLWQETEYKPSQFRNEVGISLKYKRL